MKRSRNQHRKKELSEVQELRLTIKELQAENRSLKRQLKHAERYVEIVEDDEEDDIPAPIGNICQECKRDYLQVLDLGVKKIEYCNVCKFRKVLG